MNCLKIISFVCIFRSKYKQPQLRPKGLGLGADKVIKNKDKSKTSKDKEEELSIVKNSFVKITTGKYSGLYGKVHSSLHSSRYHEMRG